MANVRIPDAEVISALYESVLSSESRISSAISDLADLFAAAEACLISVSKHSQSANHFDASGRIYNEGFATEYREHWAQKDEMGQLCLRSSLHTVLNCDAHFDERHINRSDFFNECLLKRGTRHVICVPIMNDSERIAGVSIHRNRRQGAFEAQDTALLQRLVPHLHRVMHLNLRVRGLEEQCRRTKDALDALTFGIGIADERGKIVQVNRWLEDAALRNDGLALSRGDLLASSSDGTARISQALKQCVAAAVRKPGVEPPGAMRVSRSSGRAPWVLLFVPLSPAGALSPYWRPGALVVVSDPETHPPLSGRRLQELFRFTPAEAQLALDLLNGLSPAEAAISRGIAIKTVRTQLSALLRKSDSRRQSDLMRLLAGLPHVHPFP